MVDEKTPDQQPAWSNSADQDVDTFDTIEVTEDPKNPTSAQQSQWKIKILEILTWVPPWCRYDLHNPPTFSIWHNVLFAFAGAFTVGNLYYNHPILNILAEDFDVPYVTVSRVPTLMQAGYATG